MQVSPRIFRLALLRIFADAAGNGAELSLEALSRAWKSTGLRESDLRYALHALIDSADLRCTEQDGSLYFSLARPAQRALHEQGGELRAASIEQESTLLHARYRERGRSPQAPERRASDRPALPPRHLD